MEPELMQSISIKKQSEMVPINTSEEVEVTKEFLFNHIRCTVFGHNFKVEEMRMDDVDEFTSEGSGRLTGITYYCKTCGGWIFEFYPTRRCLKWWEDED